MKDARDLLVAAAALHRQALHTAAADERDMLDAVAFALEWVLDFPARKCGVVIHGTLDRAVEEEREKVA